MDEATYKVWWSLHIRVARGETLNVEEQAAYEEGERQLDAEEHLDGDVEALRELKVRMAALEAENAQLRERKARLDAEIAQLVTQLHPRTRKLETKRWPTRNIRRFENAINIVVAIAAFRKRTPAAN